MRISEIFHSLQGEGKLTGAPSLFIRTSGCNLRCSWCDTPYSSWNPEGEELSIDQILVQIRELAPQNRHVVITGGEPLIMPETAALCDALHQRNYHITIETAATVFKPLKLHLASLSPKLSNSTPWEREQGRFAKAHEENRLNLGVIQQFIDASPDFQLKFVISSERDLEEINQILAQLTRWTPADVQLMPEGIDPVTLDSRAPWIVEICKKTGFRYSPRLHVHLFGHKRGT